MTDESRDLIVVGASAGGVEALRSLVMGLPEDFPACVVVVLHVPANSPSALPSILRRATNLSVKQAASHDRLTPGTVLVAPPDHHVIVYDDSITLSHGPRENGHRPAVDVLFRSAARTRGNRVVGVVLSGGLDDGAAGLLAISQRGGACVVQDFDDALHDSMPRAAATAVPECLVAPMAKMGEVLQDLVKQPTPRGDDPPELMEVETAMAQMDPSAMHEDQRPGQPSGFACPDCHGVLFEIDDGSLLRFRCRVGHAWSPESLVVQQSTDLESALWMALRNLEEKSALTRRLASRALERGHGLTSNYLVEEADEAMRAAELLRELIQRLAENQSQATG
ncbi:MAG TPA: chemotaxis protein CheB [Nocardioides sp.]|uniref:chemotaxis protein CheB n=1 Tax=Nocardioides sp. TaxID=35761 RepID=UPI002F41D012